MLAKLAVAALAFSSAVVAQQVGTNTAEKHPSLSIQKCSKSGGCSTEQHSVVLDANWRWVHKVGDFTNCYSGNKWDSTSCSSGKACATNCALEGGDYTSTYGITASGSSLKLGFVTKNTSGTNVGSRVYLMDKNDSKYEMINLLNGEFTFDVDVSTLGCGLNGALYFVSMDADGGMSKYSTNKAGAKYGTGYCDAQCPHDIKFINGEANSEGWASSGADSGKGKYGSCCNEMDIWEANKIAAAYTPHPCTPDAGYRCESDCADICDQPGCDWNSYRMGNTDYYKEGSQYVDTSKKITVVTQFITDDNTSSGNLIEIKRFYVQNNVVIPNSWSNFDGFPVVNSITDQFCDQQKSFFQETANAFKDKGGLKKMGEAFKKGMVLVLSLWDDTSVAMLWLDAPFPTDSDPSQPGITRGSCSIDSGKPDDVRSASPNSYVTFSNIKWGDIGSTFSGSSTKEVPKPTWGSNSSTKKSSSSSTKKASSTTTTKTTTTKSGQCQASTVTQTETETQWETETETETTTKNKTKTKTVTKTKTKTVTK